MPGDTEGQRPPGTGIPAHDRLIACILWLLAAGLGPFLLQTHRGLDDLHLTLAGLLVPVLVLAAWGVVWPARSRLVWAGAVVGFALALTPLLLQWIPATRGDALLGLFVAGWIVLAASCVAICWPARAWPTWLAAAVAMAAGVVGHAILQVDYLMGESMPGWAWLPYALLAAGAAVGVWALLRRAS